jgi:acyl-CoA reductase-like NAD-dependent aldehyde dehydrogenase
VIVSRSPQQPNDVLVETEEATPTEVRHRSVRARAAAVEWARASGPHRSAALAEAADRLAASRSDLADLMVREVGKPRTEAEGEVRRAVGILRYYSQQALAAYGDALPGSDAGSLTLTMARPRGVAGLITPWNFPLAIPVWKAAPALAYGNTVLLKPSSAALAVAQRLETEIAAALPEAAFALVAGERETAEALVDAVDVVSFTGSTAVGRSVLARATSRGIPCQAEMGGTNVAVIMPSADLGAAARDVVAAAFGFAGQKCTATSHIVVVGDARAATGAIQAAAETVTFGDPGERGVQAGPLIDAEAAQRVAGAWEEARHSGARLVSEVGGRCDGAWQPGRLVADVAASTRLGCEEVFGPIASIRSVPSLDSAVSFISAQRYGLVSALYTTDLSEAFAFARAVPTGMVKVNAPTTGVDYWAPFGGDKDSSFGPREQGTAARALYTTTQTVTVAGIR